MADVNDDPFAALAPQTVSKEELQATGALPKETKPLSLTDRLALTIIFDTQPKKRAAFLNKLGYEMDPQNDNRYRPIGSKEKFLREIDPLGGEETSSTKAYFKELAADALEAGAVGVQGAGELAGFAAGGPAGRALAYNVIESAKDTLAPLFLDKDIPTDYALRAAQTAYGAILPEAMAGGSKLATDKLIKPALEGISNGVRKLYKFGGGNISDTVWQGLQKNWKLLSDEKALKSAGDAIDSTVEKLYGMEAGDKVIPKKIEPGSLFSDALNALEGPRRAEASKLSAIGQASISKDEALAPLLAAKARIEQKPRLSDTVDEPGLAWINKEIGKLQKSGAQSYTFGEADDIVKSLQTDAYDSDEAWRTQIVQPLVEDINGLLKAKAESLGSPYAQIKQQESQIFKAFQKSRKALNKETARSLVVGGLPTGADRADLNKKALNEAVDAISATVIPGFKDQLQNDQIAHQVFKVMESSSRPKGSFGVLSTAGGLGAGTYAALNATPLSPVAAPAAAATSALTAAALVPRIGLPVAGAADQLASRLSTAAAPEAASEGVAALLRQSLAQPVAAELAAPQNVAPAPVEDDPFAGL